MQLLSKRVSDARNFSYILCCKSLFVRLESRGEALLKPAVFHFLWWQWKNEKSYKFEIFTERPVVRRKSLHELSQT